MPRAILMDEHMTAEEFKAELRGIRDAIHAARQMRSALKAAWQGHWWD